LIRAAASAIASGKPSRRQQISATARALSAVRVNESLAALARSTKSANRLVLREALRIGEMLAVRDRERQHSMFVLPRQVQGAATCYQHMELPACIQQCRNHRRGIEQVLEVVQQQQEVFTCELIRQGLQ